MTRLEVIEVPAFVASKYKISNSHAHCGFHKEQTQETLVRATFLPEVRVGEIENRSG